MKTFRDASHLQPGALSIQLHGRVEQPHDPIAGERDGRASGFNVTNVRSYTMPRGMDVELADTGTNRAEWLRSDETTDARVLRELAKHQRPS